MLSAGQINRFLDSLYILKDSVSSRLKQYFDMNLHYIAVDDSTWKKIPVVTARYNSFDSMIPDSSRSVVKTVSMNMANNLRSSMENVTSDEQNRKTEILYHKIEWHRKFSLSMVCFVLFFLGAPLGSIIRKGGLGMPLVVAIIFFLIFHLLNMFGEKFVKESMLSPFLGMWLAVLVLTPVGIFLTYKAMHDSQLFSKEFYYRSFKQVRKFFGIFKRSSSS